MEILVVDKEDLTNQLIAAKLAAKNHRVVIETNKNAALGLIAQNRFDCIMVDPAPLSEARPVIEALWRNVKGYAIKPFVILLSKTATSEEAILAGANDVLLKPLSSQDIITKIENAERFLDIYKYLNQEDDSCSAKGLINKSAFNQLFLSANNRSFRYGEVNFLVFFHLSNYAEFVANKSEEELKEVLKKLSDKMNMMRRQSDVIGILGKEDYGILLQRPKYETEPVDAINRFTETLDRLHGEFTARGVVAPKFDIDLVEIPQGILHSHLETPLKMHLFGVGEGTTGLN